MNEFTITRNDSRTGYWSVEFGAGERHRVTVNKARGVYGNPEYSPATLNWSALGSVTVEVAQEYAALLQHAAAYAAMLDTMDGATLDAWADIAEMAAARKRGFTRNAAGTWLEIAQG